MRAGRVIWRRLRWRRPAAKRSGSWRCGEWGLPACRTLCRRKIWKRGGWCGSWKISIPITCNRCMRCITAIRSCRGGLRAFWISSPAGCERGVPGAIAPGTQRSGRSAQLAASCTQAVARHAACRVLRCFIRAVRGRTRTAPIRAGFPTRSGARRWCASGLLRWLRAQWRRRSR